MAIGSAYATLGELKEYQGGNWQLDDSLMNAQVNRALSVASRAVEDYCQRQFNQESTASARLFDRVYGPMLYLDDFYEVPEQIRILDESGTYSDALDLTTVVPKPLNGMRDGVPFAYYILELRGLQHWGCDSLVEVTAKWGWPEVPDPVKEATLVLAGKALAVQGAPLGTGGMSKFGSVKIQKDDFVCGLLEPYRRYKYFLA